MVYLNFQSQKMEKRVSERSRIYVQV